METLENLKFPIGRFKPSKDIDPDRILEWINDVRELPGLIEECVDGLSPEQHLLTYREGGWNIQQIVYHLGDSHLNSYIRFKWALTEQAPKIKAYDEGAWAALNDSKGPIEDSLDFIRVLHRRWVLLMSGMSDDQWAKEFVHPETGQSISLKSNVGLYAWHGLHHLAHIKLALL